MNLNQEIIALEPKHLQFDCREINGTVSYFWTNKPVEFKYYNNELAPIMEKVFTLERELLLYRGTSLERLKSVIVNGSTSEIPNEGFWGSLSLDKAMEYGHLILCYDFHKVDRSCRTFELDSLSEKELKGLRKKFKSEEISQDKKQIFFSMFSPDRRGKVHYERDYGYYIPGNEIEALKKVIILGGGSEEELVRTLSQFRKFGGSLQKDGKEVFSR